MYDGAHIKESTASFVNVLAPEVTFITKETRWHGCDGVALWVHLN